MQSLYLYYCIFHSMYVTFICITFAILYTLNHTDSYSKEDRSCKLYITYCILWGFVWLVLFVVCLGFGDFFYFIAFRKKEKQLIPIFLGKIHKFLSTTYPSFDSTYNRDWIAREIENKEKTGSKKESKPTVGFVGFVCLFVFVRARQH